MLGRITYGLLAISLLVSVAASDALIAQRAERYALPELVEHGSVIPIICAIVAILAAAELCRMFQLRGATVHFGAVAIGCAVIVLTPWLNAGGVLRGWFGALSGVELVATMTALVMIAVSIHQLWRSKFESAIADLTATWFVIIYAGTLLSFLVLFRTDTRFGGEDSAWALLAVLAVTKVSDIGAYFLGSWFGRHQLAPRISPSKSVEGFFGGIVASALVSLLMFKLHFWAIGQGAYEEYPANGIPQLCQLTTLFEGFSMTQAIIFGGVMSISGQFGDLFESLLKRSAGVKDSGQILPGFGGILDMIDSPIFAGPVAWFLLTQVWSIL